MKRIDSIFVAGFIMTIQLCSLSASTTATCSTPDIGLQTERVNNNETGNNNVTNVQHIVDKDHNNVHNISVQRSLQESPKER